MSLDRDLVKRVEVLAGLRHVSRSATIEDLLESAIISEEAMVAAFKNPAIREAMQAFMTPEVVREVLSSVTAASRGDAKQVHDSLQMTFTQLGEQAAAKLVAKPVAKVLVKPAAMVVVKRKSRKV